MGERPIATSLRGMKYLSESWLEAATHALAGAPSPESSLRVGYDITDAPDGIGPYTLAIGPDTISFEPGMTETAATLRLTYELAVQIARGYTSAQRAFLDGTIQLGGDITALLGSASPLAEIDDRLASLRAQTDFPPDTEPPV